LEGWSGYEVLVCYFSDYFTNEIETKYK